MTITASVLLIVEEYKFYIYLDFQSATPVAITAQSLEMAISLITLFILVGGVRRIQQCAEDCDEVAISKTQMMWQIGSFASFAFANVIWTTLQIIASSSLLLDTRTGLILTLTSEVLTTLCVVFS